MRNLVVAAAVLLVTAAPGGAQITGQRHYGSGASRILFLPDSRLPGASSADEIDYVRRRIERARAGGLITRREARRLHRQADHVRLQAGVYARDGLSESETSELEERARQLREAVGRPPRMNATPSGPKSR